MEQLLGLDPDFKFAGVPGSGAAATPTSAQPCGVAEGQQPGQTGGRAGLRAGLRAKYGLRSKVLSKYGLVNKTDGQPGPAGAAGRLKALKEAAAAAQTADEDKEAAGLLAGDSGLLAGERAFALGCAVIRATGCTLSSYLEQFRAELNNINEDSLKVPQRKFSKGLNTAGTFESDELLKLAAAIRLSVHSLDDTSRRVLECLTLFDTTKPVPETLIFMTVVAHAVAEAERDGADSTPMLVPEQMLPQTAATIDALSNRSGLLQPGGKDMNPGAAPVVVPEKLDALMPALMERRKIFKIDPAVAAIAQHSFDPNWREHAFADALDAIFAICGQWGPAHFRAASTETWQFCALHQPHAEAITKPGIAGLTHPDLLAELAGVAMGLAVAAQSQAIFNEAEKKCRLAVACYERAGANMMSQMTQAMYFCGEVLRWSGQFDSALDQHLECLKFKKQLYRAAEDETKVGAPTDLARSSLAISYNRIGDMYASKQSRKKALQNYSEAHQILLGGANLNQLSMTLQRLAKVLDDQGDKPGALERREKQLEILRDLHGSNLGDPTIKECLQHIIALRKAIPPASDTSSSLQEALPADKGSSSRVPARGGGDGGSNGSSSGTKKKNKKNKKKR